MHLHSDCNINKTQRTIWWGFLLLACFLKPSYSAFVRERKLMFKMFDSILPTGKKRVINLRFCLWVRVRLFIILLCLHVQFVKFTVFFMNFGDTQLYFPRYCLAFCFDVLLCLCAVAFSQSLKYNAFMPSG